MKKIKNVNLLSMFALILLMVSCSKDSATVEEIPEEAGVSQEVLDKVSSLYFNADDVQLTNITKPDGSTEDAYLIEGDIVVYRVANGQAGGRAGFPSGGNPYKWVQIYSGMDNFNNNVIEHVMTHEIGHCVGLRHTDWFSRQSCGQSGESANPDGAVHIPGTPTGYDPTSIMLACFSASTNGEFNGNDITTLEYLY